MRIKMMAYNDTRKCEATIGIHSQLLLLEMDMQHDVSIFALSADAKYVTAMAWSSSSTILYKSAGEEVLP